MSLHNEKKMIVSLEVHFLRSISPDIASQTLESTEDYLSPNRIYKMGLNTVSSTSEQTVGILNIKSLPKEVNVRGLHH